MSIANLYAASTKKDMNLYCDSITADTFNVTTLVTDNLTVNNDALIGNDLTVDNDVTVLGDLNTENILVASDTTLDGDLTFTNASSVILPSNNANALQFGDVGDPNIVTISTLTLQPSLVVDGQILADASVAVGSVGSILMVQGSHTWTAGQAEGVNPLLISGLDGNAHGGYKIVGKFQTHPTNTNNFIFMRINSLSTSAYASRITQNTSNIRDNSGNDQWNFIDSSGTDTRNGNMAFNIYTDVQVSEDVYMCGLQTTHSVGMNNSCQNTKCSYSYDPTGGPVLANVTSLLIDMNNGNHNDTSFQYKIFRYN